MDILKAGKAVSGISALVGAVGSAIQKRKAKTQTQAQIEDEKRWWAQKNMRDVSQDYVNQRMSNLTRDMVAEQLRGIRGASSNLGTSAEENAMSKAAALDTIGKVNADAGASATQIKAAEETQARQNIRGLENSLAQRADAQAAEIAKAGAQGVQAGLNLIGTQIGKPALPDYNAQAQADIQQASKTQVVEPAPNFQKPDEILGKDGLPKKRV